MGRLEKEGGPVAEDMRIPRYETLKAWALLLMVIFTIVVSILYGYPKYKRYLAIEAAQTRLDIEALHSDRPAANVREKVKNARQ
jgi:hypothetical protein